MEDGARAPARIENLYVVTPLKKTRYASGAYNRSAVNKSGDCPRARVGFFDGQVAGADRRRGRAVPHNYRFVFFLGRKAMPRCRRVMVIEAREPRSPLSPFPKGRSRRDAPRDGDRFRVWLQVLEKLRHRVFPPILLSPPSVPLYSFFFLSAFERRLKNVGNLQSDVLYDGCMLRRLFIFRRVEGCSPAPSLVRVEGDCLLKFELSLNPV